MPLVVVSDSSPIRALHHLGLLSVCGDLYGSVIVPEAVQRELRLPTSTCAPLEITEHAGFEVRAPRSSPVDLGVPTDLDPGETESITLAIELRADLVLIDERKGTETARRLGLATIGVFGVLLEAKRRALVGRVLPCVDRLVNELRFLFPQRYGSGWRSWQESKLGRWSMISFQGRSTKGAGKADETP